MLAATGFTGSPPLVPALTALAPLLAEGDAGRRRDLTEDDVRALGLLARAGPTSLDGGTTGRRRGDDTQRYLAAVRLVLGAAREEPLILVIDDAHALDEASAALVAHLLSAALLRAEAEQVRFAALLAVRPGEGSPAARRAVARMSAEPGTAELELGGLDELDLNELLASFGPHPPSRPLLRLVRSSAAGNPLHSRLLWDHLLATGGALVEGDRVVLGDPRELAAARLDVDDVIDTRLDALDEGDRAILAVAAVLGPEGDLAGLAEVIGSEPEEVEAALLRGEAAGLCHLRGDRYTFDQPLVAAVLGRSISARRCQRLHLRLAEALAGRPEPARARRGGSPARCR